MPVVHSNLDLRWQVGFDSVGTKAGLATGGTWLDASITQLNVDFYKTKSLGYRWLRIGSRWDLWEAGATKPANPNFAFQVGGTDRIMHFCMRHGLTPVWELCFSPRWARHTNAAFNGSYLTPPLLPSDYADAAELLYLRYGPTGTWWSAGGTWGGSGFTKPAGFQHWVELWNEPNLGEFWGGVASQMSNKAITVNHYTDMAIAAYNRLKSLNSNTKVISGGLAAQGGNGHMYLYQRFMLERALAVGQTRFCDYFGLHPYPGGSLPTTSWSSYVHDEDEPYTTYQQSPPPSWISNKWNLCWLNMRDMIREPAWGLGPNYPKFVATETGPHHQVGQVGFLTEEEERDRLPVFIYEWVENRRAFCDLYFDFTLNNMDSDAGGRLPGHGVYNYNFVADRLDRNENPRLVVQPLSQMLYKGLPSTRQSDPPVDVVQVDSDLNLKWSVARPPAPAVFYARPFVGDGYPDVGTRSGVGSSLIRRSTDLDLRWSEYELMIQDITLFWNVENARVETDLDLRWGVEDTPNRVHSDLDLRWSTRGRVQSDVDLRWSVLGRTHADLDLKWSVLGRNSSDLTLLWNLAGSVGDVSADIVPPFRTIYTSTGRTYSAVVEDD